MNHDLLAELAGYEAELAGYERQHRTERADAVRTEITRVIGEVQVKIERELTVAEGHEDAGQDLLAAQARVEAKRLARGLPEEHRPERLRALFPETAGASDAAAAEPQESAVPAKRGAKATPPKGGE